MNNEDRGSPEQISNPAPESADGEFPIRESSVRDSRFDRRSMLKSSVLGGALLAEGLFAPPQAGATQARGAQQAPASPAAAPSSNDATAPLGEVEQIKLEYVFQIRIDFSERVTFKTPRGTQSYVPAYSGKIEGPRLQGIVWPHSGADYGGNGLLDAHYMLQASDGAMIYIHNQGYIWRRDQQAISRNDPSWGGDAEYYFRITPYFNAPDGPHEWLSRTVIVGSGRRHAKPDYTIFTYYAVL
jgi:Protein of unknown function (DUF3237)